MENYKLRTTKCRLCLAKIICVLFILCGSVFSVDAQSTSQSFPTPISANEISGKITVRDVGDARLTSYFYVFYGNQGDIFINIKTSNLDGDIDIFTAENLRPLTKITIFSDVSENETGRAIYLRKPEKLILRVQGRTPNDNPATFNMKFAGSFAPAPAVAENAASELPEVKTENQSDIQVNSVGTIISVKPKATPQPKETIAKNESRKNKTQAKETENTEGKISANEADRQTVAENATQKPPEKVVETPQKPDISSNIAVKENVPSKKAGENNSPVKRKVKTATAKTTAKKPVAETKKTPEPNPLANVHLIVLFKDGTKIERAMNEVLRVGVDRGILTLITKDGVIVRYQILDVAKMTIE